MEKVTLGLSIFLFVCSIANLIANLIVLVKSKKTKRNCKTEKSYERCKWEALSTEEKELLNRN